METDEPLFLSEDDIQRAAIGLAHAEALWEEREREERKRPAGVRIKEAAQRLEREIEGHCCCGDAGDAVRSFIAFLDEVFPDDVSPSKR